ncbi:hypothetical protein FACS1894216_11410 [Synergistales bacterium]|nr:hypothetical protein FACS1894216_11410 [Synergistales bacterium]
MSAETPGRNSALRLFALLGLFFGIGFASGFGVRSLIYNGTYGNAAAAQVSEAQTEDAVSPDELIAGAVSSDARVIPVITDEPEPDTDLVLTEHELDDDDNGLFISGTVYNKSTHAYDAVSVTFELCDAKGNPYSAVTDSSRDRMERGDSWGFTIYIPYKDITRFSSYRLQNIMGTTK